MIHVTVDGNIYEYSSYAWYGYHGTKLTGMFPGAGVMVANRHWTALDRQAKADGITLPTLKAHDDSDSDSSEKSVSGKIRKMKNIISIFGDND